MTIIYHLLINYSFGSLSIHLSSNHLVTILWRFSHPQITSEETLVQKVYMRLFSQAHTIGKLQNYILSIGITTPIILLFKIYKTEIQFPFHHQRTPNFGSMSKCIYFRIPAWRVQLGRPRSLNFQQVLPGNSHARCKRPCFEKHCYR